MGTREILLWIGFIAVCAAIYLISRRIKKQTEENGIETDAVISRITDEGGTDAIDLHYYARYRTEDGEEIEGIISNPSGDLEEGMNVRIKYHSKHKTNARLVR